MSAPRDKKLCSIEEAVASIADGQTLATAGFVSAAHPEALTAALERRFFAEGKPRDLTLVFGAGQGDRGKRGLNHLAHEGLLRRVVGGHMGLAPELGNLAIEEKIESYNFPQGVMVQLFREIAAGRPGVITHIGLDTFIDPIHDGGRLNKRTPAGLVERVELAGKTWLFYHAFPIHVGLIRATAADPFGNLIMDREALIGEVLQIAQAVHNSGGVVIAQVAELRGQPAEPMSVHVPGIYVDKIAVADPDEHRQTFSEDFNPGYCSSAIPGMNTHAFHDPLPRDERYIIAGRACDDIPEGGIINLGIGIPELIARIAAERGILDRFIMTIESGAIGGIPASGLSFGASLYPQAIIEHPAQFDFYDGRGLDFAALGLAQADRHGNVNVSKFGRKVAGVGGFVNITQTAKHLIFCGTFTADGLEVAVENGKLRIVREGKVQKFIGQVEHLTFSAERSRGIGQQVLYVTERAVFSRCDEGLELIEIAPGIDLQRDVLDQMGFAPIIREVRPMPTRLFESS